MYNKSVLENGIRIISEEIKHIRSVSIGLWVQSGSRQENNNNNGVAHFLEHMLFKGTKERNCLEIARAVDSIGGVANAFTGKEATAYYVKIPDYHLPSAVSLLADIFQNSLFDREEMTKEKAVIEQEINMVEDTPEDQIHDLFEEVFWGKNLLAQPVLGTKKSLAGIDRDKLLDFYNGHYRGANLIVAAAGNLKHRDFVSLINSSFKKLKSNAVLSGMAPPAASAQVFIKNKALEQAHLLIGSLAPSAASPQRFTGLLLNTILGGSMSSRLFQEIREKRGLAYAISSFLVPYQDTGMIGIYAGTAEEKAPAVVKLIKDEMARMAGRQVSPKEMRLARELIKGNLLLGMENTDNVMFRLAKNESCCGRNITVPEVLEEIDAVTSRDIRRMAQELFNPEIVSLAAIGNLQEDDFNETRIPQAKRSGIR